MTIADYGFAIWETFYVTVLSTAFSLVIGLPLGVLLVAGDKDGILPLPGWLMHLLNIIINILRSVPFLILMICVFPLTRIIVGTTVGTKATIVPLVVAAFPFVARLVETSLRELDEGVVEAAQSMGATPFQIITKVMIPECLPGLISSMTTALTTILGYSAMSGVIGGGGLRLHGQRQVRGGATDGGLLRHGLVIGLPRAEIAALAACPRLLDLLTVKDEEVVAAVLEMRDHVHVGQFAGVGAWHVVQLLVETIAV